MNYDTFDGPQVPEQTISQTIAQYGAWTVLGAALLAVLNPQQLRPPPTTADNLDAHLRKDVGLPPVNRVVLPSWPPF